MYYCNLFIRFICGNATWNVLMGRDRSEERGIERGRLAYCERELAGFKSTPWWGLFMLARLAGWAVAGGRKAILRRCYWLLTGQIGRHWRDERDGQIIAQSGLFDGAQYLAHHPDVIGFGGTALDHFIRHGSAEGRWPNAWFDPVFYARTYGDVTAAGRNGLAHFIQYGMSEGRLPRQDFRRDQMVLQPVDPMDPETVALVRHWYDDQTPQVSILILNWNKADLTQRCLTALWTHTAGFTYEIIVVDNGSEPDEIQKLDRFVGRFRLIRLPVNRYFGEGNNLAAEQARGQFLVFLNNDAFVTARWLEPLMTVLLTQSDAGIVGPKFVYPDGRLQEAGAVIDSQGCSVQFGKGGQPDDPQFNVLRQVGYCSAACILIRRDVFERALGFDLMWDPAYYEDVDLCLKAGQLGLKTYYCPDTTIIHVENGTSSDVGRQLNLHNIVAINRLKYVERWGKEMPPAGLVRLDFPPLPVSLPGQRRAALFTPYDILPGGGEMYLLTVAAALADKMAVTLVTNAPYSRLRLLTMGRELSLNLDGIQMMTWAQAQRQPRFDLFVAMANEIVPPVPGLGRRNFYMCQFPFPLGRGDLLARRKFWPDYQAIVVNSPFTQLHARRAMGRALLKPKSIQVVAPPVQLIPPAVRSKRGIVLGVGRFFSGGHCKRHDVMIQAFRRLQERHGFPLELHLAGALHPQPHHRDYLLMLQDLAQGLPVVFHLNVARAELVDLYAGALVYWHAAGIDVDPQIEPEKCEHFGITVVEAMSAGCIPVVPNRGGPAALVQHGRSGFHYEDGDELAQMTARIWNERRQDWVTTMAQHAVADAAAYAECRFRDHWLELTR